MEDYRNEENFNGLDEDGALDPQRPKSPFMVRLMSSPELRRKLEEVPVDKTICLDLSGLGEPRHSALSGLAALALVFVLAITMVVS